MGIVLHHPIQSFEGIINTEVKTMTIGELLSNEKFLAILAMGFGVLGAMADSRNRKIAIAKAVEEELNKRK